jgi:lipid II:glycine glycyltransferase (peptidoglycan interpeptide bridge formation enzyme)
LEKIITKKIEVEKWVRILQNSPFSSPFQTKEFYDLYNSIEGFSAEVFAVELHNQYEALVVVTVQKEKGVKSFFSKRGIVYGGPLLIGNDDRFLQLLLNHVTNYYRKKLIYLEIRNNFDYHKYLTHFKNSGWQYNKHLNVELITEGKNVESILSKMKYNRRREIRLSYTKGAETKIATNEEDVEALYTILENLYKTRVKLPLPSLDYFLNLYRNSLGRVILVIHNETVIGGSFCFYYPNSAIYTLYYCGIRNYDKKIFATHLAVLGVIEFAVENNLKIVDFMGAGKPDEDYGVRDYKLQFGGDLIEYGRFKIIFNPILYKTGELGLKILSKIK